jgi:ADP-ribose pyrophosphatase YjhB (NUDIX family)
MKPREQPKIVTMIKVANSEGKELLYRRKYQPYIHRLGWPSGKLHMDESLADAAVRELQEKTGLVGIKLEHRGLVDLEVTQGEHVISRVMVHLFSGECNKEKKLSSNERGDSVWAKMSDYRADQLMPASNEMNLLMQSKTFFFSEIQQAIS